MKLQSDVSMIENCRKFMVHFSAEEEKAWKIVKECTTSGTDEKEEAAKRFWYCADCWSLLYDTLRKIDH